MSAVCMYGHPGAETYEKSIQDAVDLAWFSFPDDDPIIIEEWLQSTYDTKTAVWVIPRGDGPDGPPEARILHRVEV